MTNFSPVPVSIFAIAVPLFISATGGLLSLKAGIINIALEGMMFFSAFVAVLVSLSTGSLLSGIIAAVISGGITGLFYAILCIRLKINQFITGIVLNLFISSSTLFLMRIFWDTELISPETKVIFSPYSLFHSILLIILAMILIFLTSFFLNSTIFGFRLRLIEENPLMAHSLGIKVNVIRFSVLLLSGFLAGFSGGLISLGQTGFFSPEIITGQGYIAIATMIAGKTPAGIFLVSLFFGLMLKLSGAGYFSIIIPYLLAIFAAALFSKNISSIIEKHKISL